MAVAAIIDLAQNAGKGEAFSRSHQLLFRGLNSQETQLAFDPCESVKSAAALAISSAPPHHGTGLASRNDLTTMLLGCTPTGIIVSREYSVGSSLVGLRFWMTLTSPDREFSTSR